MRSKSNGKKADLYGEGKYIVIMGGLHVKMASLKMVGHWLDKSGWGIALVQADITTRGSGADGILKAAHVNTRACTAHQKRNLSGRSCMSLGSSLRAQAGRVGLAAITRRMISQVDYTS